MNPQEGSSNSALISATKHASAAIVGLLLDAGADANFRVYGDSPLKVSERQKQQIHRGPMIYSYSCCDHSSLQSNTDKPSDTHLQHAASRGDLMAVKLLLNCPKVNVDSPDADNAPALHFAIRNGHFRVSVQVHKRVCVVCVLGV